MELHHTFPDAWLVLSARKPIYNVDIYTSFRKEREKACKAMFVFNAMRESCMRFVFSTIIEMYD